MTVDPNKPVVAPVADGPPSDPPASEGGSRKLTAEDAAALARTHEEKRKEAERRALDAEARANEAERRRQELERRMMGPAPTDPRGEAMQAKRAAAALGDPNAMLELDIIDATIQTATENQRLKAMVKAGVSGDEWDAVEGVLRANPNMDVTEARKRARGPAADEVTELKRQLAEKDRLLEQEKHRVRVPNMAITPALVPPDAASVSATQMRAVLAKGGEEARRLQQRMDSPRGTPGHVEVDWNQ